MKWIIFSTVVLAIFGGIIWLNKEEKNDFTGDPAKVITDGPIADHTDGSKDQKVILIEYGDFQCGGCQKMYEPVKQLVAKYQNQLTFVFRNRPLTNIHANALAASTAAEAAGLQNKFFEMHDMLYSQQTAWANVSADQRGAVFEGYASTLGLDTAKFKQDIKNEDISKKISRDKSTSATYNISQTPSFILQGKLLAENIATDPEALENAIKEAIKEAYPAAATP